MERVYSAYFNTLSLKKNRGPKSIGRKSSDGLSLEEKKKVLILELQKALRSGLRIFLFSYGAKAFTAVLLASRKWNSLEYGYADAFRLLTKIDSLRFGAFMGSLVVVFRSVQSYLRLYSTFTSSRSHRAIAGFISGLSLLLDTKSRRSTFALYLCIRALDVAGKYGTKAGLIPTWKYSAEALFSLANGPIMYAFIFEPKLLPKSYYNFILRMGNVTDRGLEYSIRHNVVNSVKGKCRPCQPHYHLESCTVHNTTDFIYGIARATQLYLPVHFLPSVIFKSSRMLRDPARTLLSICYATLRSSCFLSAYQIFIKSMSCMLRNARGKDAYLHAWISGWATGFALLLEDSKRRSELMLYCVPRAFMIIWKILERKKLVRYVSHAEVVVFCFSMATIMSTPAEYFKPTYLKILRFLFGSEVFL